MPRDAVRIIISCGVNLWLGLAPGLAATVSCGVRPVTIQHSPGYVPNPEQTVLLDPATYPDALCNDGTPGAYGIRRGFGAASNRWIIWLHGGGFCVDQRSCSPRMNSTLTSSEPYTDGYQVGIGDGIQSADPTENPDFYDANLVVVSYCSSDNWTGASNGDPAFPASDVRSWHFQGRAIIAAVIQDLIANQGLGPGQEILFGGGSAGGIAVFENANDLALPPDSRLLLASDAGYALDVEGYDDEAPDGISTASPTLAELELATGSALWGGRGDANCTAAAVTTQQQQACYFPPTITHGGYIKTPIFVRQSEADHVQLTDNGLVFADIGQSSEPNSVTYMQYFATQMVQELSTIDSWNTVFSTADTNHTMMDNSDFTGVEESFTDADGITTTTTIQQAFGAWYRQPCHAAEDIQPLSAADPDGVGRRHPAAHLATL